MKAFILHVVSLVLLFPGIVMAQIGEPSVDPAESAVEAARTELLLANAEALLDPTVTVPERQMERTRDRLEALHAVSVYGPGSLEIRVQITMASLDLALVGSHLHGEPEAAPVQRTVRTLVSEAPAPTEVRTVRYENPGPSADAITERSVVLTSVELHEDRGRGGHSSRGTDEVWEWPVEDPRITSSFGRRTDPITGESRMHRGTDFGAPTGTPVYAPASGEVVLAGWCSRGTGNCVVMDHPDGTRSQYFHLSEVSCRAGEHVDQGEEIGEIGSTGRSTGPHLHFQLGRDGEDRDPEEVIGTPVE